MARVGYTRVSTIDQNFDRQLDGIPVDKVFADKITAAPHSMDCSVTCDGLVKEHAAPQRLTAPVLHNR